MEVETEEYWVIYQDKMISVDFAEGNKARNSWAKFLLSILSLIVVNMQYYHVS